MARALAGVRPVALATALPVVLAALLVTQLAGGSPGTQPDEVVPATGPAPGERPVSIVWFDPVDPTSSGWEHGDYTAGASAEFHVDSHFSTPFSDYSWWCGRLDPAYAGGDGYGNAWDQRLLIPPIDLGTTLVERRSWGGIKAEYRDAEGGHPSDRSRDIDPVLTFCYRYDTEPGYDHISVEVLDDGHWTELLPPWSGSSAGWHDQGAIPVGDYGDPLELRFRFVSDGAGSDEDGLYDSDGGALQLDSISVWDYITGESYFYDDAEDGAGLCIPSVPEAAGDWWHLREDYCSSAAYAWGAEESYCWRCVDEADSSRVPPGLRNWLRTPFIDRGYAWLCTLRFWLHPEVPADAGDYWTEELTWDSGQTWYHMGTWWGDIGTCYGFAEHGVAEGMAFAAAGAGDVAARWTLYTDDDGCGPGAAGSAGLTLDWTWLEADNVLSRRQSGTTAHRPSHSRVWPTIRALAR